GDGEENGKQAVVTRREAKGRAAAGGEGRAGRTEDGPIEEEVTAVGGIGIDHGAGEGERAVFGHQPIEAGVGDADIAEVDTGKDLSARAREQLTAPGELGADGNGAGVRPPAIGWALDDIEGRGGRAVEGDLDVVDGP